MLEVVIKQNDKQIGQLQFDSNWKFEDAMNVLGMYVAKEVPRKGREVSIKEPEIKEPEIKEVFVETKNAEEHKEKNGALSEELSIPHTEHTDLVAVHQMHNAFDSASPLYPSDYKILDRYATGKKRVMKYRGNNVTGNHIAVLIALKLVGGEISAANDLAEALKQDARYDSRYDSGTYRQVLRALAELGFIEKNDGDVRVITELGKKVAALFTILPKAETPS